MLICLHAKSAKASSAKNPRPYGEASAKYDCIEACVHAELMGKEAVRYRVPDAFYKAVYAETEPPAVQSNFESRGARELCD